MIFCGNRAIHSNCFKTAQCHWLPVHWKRQLRHAVARILAVKNLGCNEIILEQRFYPENHQNSWKKCPTWHFTWMKTLYRCVLCHLRSSRPRRVWDMPRQCTPEWGGCLGRCPALTDRGGCSGKLKTHFRIHALKTQYSYTARGGISACWRWAGRRCWRCRGRPPCPRAAPGGSPACPRSRCPPTCSESLWCECV